MNYILMNKNEHLLPFHTEFMYGNTEVFPDAAEDSINITGYKGIADWVERRNYAKHKESLRKWLHEWQLDTIDGFLDVTHGLGLNDTLWVKRADSDLTWEKVNLYNNDFSDVVEKTAFETYPSSPMMDAVGETGLHGLQLKTTSPEFTSEGSFAKCWKKESGEVFLYKQGAAGASNVGLEPYSEYYSSQISGRLQPTVNYDLVQFKGRLCTRCKMFTSEKLGFVPMYKYFDVQSAGNITISKIMEFMREKDYEIEFRWMLLIDSICLNQDRHLGNFGFWVDTDSYEIQGFAPLFDYNCSFFCNALDQDLEDIDRYMQEYQVGHKLGGTFWDVAKSIITPDMRGKLPPDIYIDLHPQYNLPVDRIDKILDYINENYTEQILDRNYIRQIQRKRTNTPPKIR